MRKNYEKLLQAENENWKAEKLGIKVLEAIVNQLKTSEKIRYNRELLFCTIIEIMSPDDKVTTRTAEQARG